jgi:protocatechuate 4,5-dioxygenase alpha chain
MGSVERCDRTLPLNQLVFAVRRDARLRARWRTDLPGLAREFGLSAAELAALEARDPRRLLELGVHQYYVPQVLRLFFGAGGNSNASPALDCYRRAFPDETARALAAEARRHAGEASPAPGGAAGGTA